MNVCCNKKKIVYNTLYRILRLITLSRWYGVVRTVRYGPDDIFPRWQFDPRYFERLVIRQSVQLLKVHEKKYAYYDCVLCSSIDKFDLI